MAFDSSNLYLDRAATNSTTPQVGVAMHKYKSTTDTLSTITASGYFNNAYSTAPSNNSNAPIQLQVGDAILIEGSNGTAMYQITAVTPNVTVSTLPLTAAGTVIAAAVYTTTGGSATEVISLPGLGITATCAVSVILKTAGATPRTVSRAYAGTNDLTVVFSGDPSNDHVINYIITTAVP